MKALVATALMAAALTACSEGEAADVAAVAADGHPVCTNAGATFDYQLQFTKDALEKRDSGVWSQDKMMMVIDRMKEYAHKIDPKVREYASFCDDLDRIRSHYAL